MNPEVDIADVLSQVTIVDGFGGPQAQTLGAVHAALPRPVRTEPDPAVLASLRVAAGKGTALELLDELETLLGRLRTALTDGDPNA